MNGLKVAMNGLAVGATLMYFLDPARGKRRRALVRDHTVSKWHHLNSLLEKAQRDASNRTYGVFSEIKAAIPGGKKNNFSLIERAKSIIGRAVTHPHAIAVSAENGKIVLAGAVLQEEVDRLLSTVKSVKGVKEVVNQLDVHKSSDHISALQGGRRRSSGSDQESWTPAIRIAAGGLGSAMVAFSLINRSRFKLSGAMAGIGLLTRAISNLRLKSVVGAGNHRHSVEIKKTVHIASPVSEVFALWSDYRKFPLFMNHVKEVHDLGNGKSRWTARGPAGIAICWDAALTQRIKNKLLAWKSVPGSPLETEGTIRFDEGPENSTRISIQLRYQPPAGTLGNYAASLFGANPKQEIDDDMTRLKSLLEYGKTRANGHQITKEAITAVLAQ